MKIKTFNRKFFVLCLSIFASATIYSQQNVSISDIPTTPNASSVLDVYSTSKGMLVPRLTTAQRQAIVSPANGLLVFDTDVNCFMFYTNSTTSWNSLCAAGVGSNGANALSNTINVPAGPICPNGGITLQMGSDTNNNGILDATEITSTNNICNGTTGATGPAGATGPQGPIGLTGPAGATGPAGPQGPIGLTGPAGPQGPIGLTGPAGATGPAGPQGPIGLTGPAGATGPAGPQGPIGLTGPAGATGPAGPQGPIGLTGPAGATGPAGPQGPIGLTGPAGATGPAGPIGLTGPAGATGPAGPQGPIGLTGPAGATGPAGPQGPIGLTGPAGATGPAGPQGPIGLTGPTGATGPAGPAGATGINASVVLTGSIPLTAGSICPMGGVTIESGLDSNNNGFLDASEVTSTSYICNGSTGPVGPTGATGPAGPQGPIGLTGAAGATGPQGAIGLTGPAGATGPAGPIGLTGPAGATGPAGPQGPTGLTGATGATGPQGPAGPTWQLTSDNFTPAGNLQIITTLPQTVTSTNQAWLVGGNNFGTTALPYKLGTISNDHVDLISNNLVRGRLSNLGEFFIGTTTTALPGDLMNGVGNVTFPWAINGYTNQNGAGVYGLRQAGSVGTWGSVQGETDATIGANNSGVSGLVGATTHRGVTGQKPAGGAGWGGLFLNDLGYTGFFGAASDQNVKKNIQPISSTDALSKIKSLKAYTYEYKYDYLGPNTTNYGFLAQEIEQIFPEMVQEKDFTPSNARNHDVNDDGQYKIKAVSTISLIPVLVEGMKEQQKIIEELKAEIELLKSEIKKD